MGQLNGKGNGTLKLIIYVALGLVTAASVGVAMGAYRAGDLATAVTKNCADIEKVKGDFHKHQTDSAEFVGRVETSLGNIEDDVQEIKEVVNDLRDR